MMNRKTVMVGLGIFTRSQLHTIAATYVVDTTLNLHTIVALWATYVHFGISFSHVMVSQQYLLLICNPSKVEPLVKLV